jgi:hypothetical protein
MELGGKDEEPAVKEDEDEDWKANVSHSWGGRIRRRRGSRTLRVLKKLLYV